MLKMSILKKIKMGKVQPKKILGSTFLKIQVIAGKIAGISYW